MAPWLLDLALIGAGAAALLLLALKLRGPGGGRDLTGPPKRKPRRITADEKRRLRKLVAGGDENGALRLIREAGHGEAEALKLVALTARLEALAGPVDPPPDPAWTEAVRSDDGLTYGRAFAYNEALQVQDSRGKRGELDAKE